MKIHNVKQGSGEWIELRLGVVTASELDALISPEQKIRTGQGPQTYLYRKICERVLGAFSTDASSFAMGQGVILEHEALPWFEFTHDVAVQRVGFCTTDDGKVGCSPDGLIGEDGGLEIKCPQPETHLKYILDGILPKDHWGQVHGSMFVTGRAWWNFLSYSRQFPPFLIRVERDEEIQAAIGKAVGEFLPKLEAGAEKISAMRNAANAVAQAAYDARVAKGQF